MKNLNVFKLCAVCLVLVFAFGSIQAQTMEQLRMANQNAISYDQLKKDSYDMANDVHANWAVAKQDMINASINADYTLYSQQQIEDMHALAAHYQTVNNAQAHIDNALQNGLPTTKYDQGLQAAYDAISSIRQKYGLNYYDQY